MARKSNAFDADCGSPLPRAAAIWYRRLPEVARQLLYYMGWVDKNLGNGPCRGAIIANEITDDLKIAVARVSGVALLQYKMQFTVDPVE